jgi:hypothetical protein
MKITYSIAYRFIMMSLLVLVWACKDEEESLNLSRQFTPAGFEITGSATSAVVRWDRSLFTTPGNVEYKLELSQQQDFSQVDFQTTTTNPEVTVLDTDIAIRTDYYARVRALGKNGTADSRWLVSPVFRILGEIFIKPVKEYDVVTDAVRIYWDTQETLTKIVVRPQGGTAFEVAISAAEAEAGEKLVTGLAQNTAYTVEIYNATNVSKGFVTFRTKPAFPQANIVDLRGITGRPKVLGDTLRHIPSGSIILLKRGQVYTVDASDGSNKRTFDRSVTIMSGPDFIEKLATIHLTTNFNFIANSVIDSVVFRDINIRGVRLNGESFDNDYVINSNVVATVGKIKLENCRISRLRGTVRVQTGGAGTKVERYDIHNCVIDSIREFAVVMASGGSAFAHVKISNSTFTRCRKFVNHSVAGNQSLVIENCTFNEVPTGSDEALATPTNFLIDYGAFAPANPVQITNSIIGKTWIETPPSADAGGIRGASVVVTNSYTLSDFVSKKEQFQISGVTPYSGSSTSVFMNPAAGDFRIKDNSFPGRTTAGDPRWR